jgi:hypothetical protein
MASKKKSPKQSRGRWPYGVAGVLVLILIIGIIGVSQMGSGRQELNYDFTNPDVVKEWSLAGSAARSVSPQGLSIQNGNFRLLSPAPGSSAFIGPTVAWSQFPYIRIQLTKGPRERQLTFRWNPENSLAKSYGFPLRIPANTELFVFNTQALRFSNTRFSVRQYPVVQFGFEAIDNSQTESVDYQIKSVTLLSSLSPGESWQLVENGFLEPETFFASAVNFLTGFYIFEKPVVFYFGITLLGGALIVAFLRRNRLAMSALIGTALLFHFILDMQFNVSLWSHAQYSHGKSAWHESEYDEHASRFGKEFADLAKAFEEQVPRGSKVYFAQETLHTVWSERNWIALQYFPAYQSVDLNEADYIFHYYPNEYKLDRNVETLYEVGKNAKLLKVIRG